MSRPLPEIPLVGRWSAVDRSVFRLTGPDRVRYLDGQVTQNVEAIKTGAAKPGCLCSIKGKVEFLVWITTFEDCLLVDGQPDQREELLLRLDRYLIADDCEIEDLSDDWNLVHHFGESEGGVSSRRLRETGWDSWNEAAPRGEGEKISTEEWAFASLLAGVPAYPHELTGSEFPSELGLDKWAVDFHKGCYLGQEIVSRLESVGKVKRGLRLVIADSPLPQLATVRINDDETGTVIRSISSPGEKNFIASGWFRGASNLSQVVDVESID